MSNSRQVLAILAIAFVIMALSRGQWTTRLSQIQDVDVAK